MFGLFSTRQTVAVAVAEAPVDENPAPRARVIGHTCSKEKLEAYEAVAASINFVPTELLMAKFHCWLKENSMPIYDSFEVDCYLTKKLFYWNWIPLREKDKGKINLLGYKDNNTKYPRTWNTSTASTDNKRVYNKAVPMDVLQTIQKIDQLFPQLGLYVSDVAIPKADPFLMVGIDGTEPLVIECWDEPGFQSRNTKPA